MDVNATLKFSIAIDQLARLAELSKNEAIHDAATGNKERQQLGAPLRRHMVMPLPI